MQRTSFSLEDISRVAAKLLRHHERHSQDLFNRAPKAIEQAGLLLSTRGSKLWKQALEAGEATGMSPEMVEEALKNFTKHLRWKQLSKIREKQLRHIPPRVRVYPRIIFHVLAGNLFLSGWESMLLGNLLGACNIVRTSSHDPLFPHIWVKALSQADSLFADANFVGWWPHEENALTSALIQSADAVVAFGDNSSVGAIRSLVPLHTRFVGHGHKLSFALVEGSLLDDDTLSCNLARAAAYDFSVYDQQGCLSPRCLFIQGGSEKCIKRFAEYIVDFMCQLSHALPLHKLTLEEAATLAREREEALIEYSATASKTSRHKDFSATTVFSAPSDKFLVMRRSLAPFAPSPVNRVVTIRTFKTTNELKKVLEPYRGLISTFGVSSPRDEWLHLAKTLLVGRVCSLGNMQKPPLGWTHDGYQPLAALVTSMELGELK